MERVPSICLSVSQRDGWKADVTASIRFREWGSREWGLSFESQSGKSLTRLHRWCLLLRSERLGGWGGEKGPLVKWMCGGRVSAQPFENKKIGCCICLIVITTVLYCLQTFHGNFEYFFFIFFRLHRAPPFSFHHYFYCISDMWCRFTFINFVLMITKSLSSGVVTYPHIKKSQ